MSETQNFVFDGFDMSDPNIKPWDGQGGGPPDVPLGEHLFECVGIESATTKAGDGKNIVIDWKVVGGDADGKVLKQWYLSQGDKFKEGHKRRLVHVFVYSLRVPLTPSGGFEAKDALGRRMYAVVSHEESSRYDPTTQATKIFVNANLSCERPSDDEPAVTTSAPPRASTAPPARPPAAASAPPARPPGRPPAAAPPVRPR